MPEEWTGTVVGKMHVHRISYEQLAEKLGYTKAYVSMVLSGSRRPAGAKEKFMNALNECIAESAGRECNG